MNCDTPPAEPEGYRFVRRRGAGTWRDKCGQGVPIGGVQTRDAGAGGVFRRAVIDRCGPSGRRIQNYVGCKALPLYGAREESFRAGRGSGSGERRGGNSLRNLFAPQSQSDGREIQKPLVFGGVLFHISFAVERNMAAGGIEKRLSGRCGQKWPALGSAEYSRRRERSKRRRWRIQRGERVAAVKISSARRQAAQKFRAPQQCSFSNINRAAGPYGVRLSGCVGKCGRGAGQKSEISRR